MEALEALVGIDETDALTGATPNRGLSRMSGCSARLPRRNEEQQKAA